jgi:hypothetical protein
MWRIKNKERDRNRDVLRKYKIISRIINKSKYTSPKYLFIMGWREYRKVKTTYHFETEGWSTIHP